MANNYRVVEGVKSGIEGLIRNYKDRRNRLVSHTNVDQCQNAAAHNSGSLTLTQYNQVPTLQAEAKQQIIRDAIRQEEQLRVIFMAIVQ